MAHGSPCIQGPVFWTPPPPIAFLATHHAGTSATVTATASSTSTAAAEATAAAAVHVLVDWACEKGYPKELVLEAFANATATAYVSAYASIYATTSSTGGQSLQTLHHGAKCKINCQLQSYTLYGHKQWTMVPCWLFRLQSPLDCIAHMA